MLKPTTGELVVKIMNRVDVSHSDTKLIRNALWATENDEEKAVALINSPHARTMIQQACEERAAEMARRQEQIRDDDNDFELDLAISSAADDSGYNINDVQRAFMKALLKRVIK